MFILHHFYISSHEPYLSSSLLQSHVEIIIFFEMPSSYISVFACLSAQLILAFEILHGFACVQGGMTALAYAREEGRSAIAALLTAK